MKDYLNANTISELCCFLVALFALSSAKERIWRYFSAYLIVALFTELISIFLINHGAKRTNFIYNLYGIYEIVFISLMLHQILRSRITNWRPFIIGLYLVILLYAYETISHGLNMRYDLTNGVFGVLVVLCALYYLKLLLEDQHYISLERDPNFWWIVGTIFFYFAFTSLNVLHVQLIKIPRAHHPLFSYTYKTINVILYSIWSYAFICKKWNSTTSVSSSH